MDDEAVFAVNNLIDEMKRNNQLQEELISSNHHLAEAVLALAQEMADARNQKFKDRVLGR